MRNFLVPSLMEFEKILLLLVDRCLVDMDDVGLDIEDAKHLVDCGFQEFGTRPGRPGARNAQSRQHRTRSSEQRVTWRLSLGPTLVSGSGPSRFPCLGG